MAKQTHQSGFAVVEALLVIIILGLLGFTGWFVWHSKQVANKTFTEASKSVQAATPLVIVPLNTQQAVGFVQKFYDTYLKTVNATNVQNTSHPSADNQSLQAAGLAAVKPDLDPNFYNLIAPAQPGRDNVGCALHAVDSYKASLVGVSSNEATVGVAMYSSSDINGIITVKVNLNTHKITNIVCPQ